MLCIANVHLNGWPLSERRDVDPTDERIKGLLRAGYIVPLVLPRARPVTPPEIPAPVTEEPAEAPEASGSDDGGGEGAEPASLDAPAKPKPRARRATE